MTERLRLGLVLAGLFLLVGAGNLADSSTAAETSAEPSAPASTTPAWAPSLKGATFKSRRPDAGADLVASASQEPFAGKFAAPAIRMPDSSATGSAPGGTSLTTGAHKGLLCSDCHASSVSPPAEGQPAQDQDRPELKWSTRYTASVPPMRVYSSHLTELLGLDISQPDGSSRVCVGCHAMSDKISRPENRFGPDDLARTHPVSFTYDGGLAMRARRAGLRDPATTPSGLGGTIAGDLLDSRGKVQCSSCHDAHGPGRGPKLMRFPYDKTTSQGSNLCRICHNK
jgi:predicted CXXCH cytochrome family protein